MKNMLALLITCFIVLNVTAQSNKENIAVPDSTKAIEIVEAACGECQFGLHGRSCDLAVRINGKAYFVDGTKIDDHGNAHAADGFCETIRKAEVQGKIVDGRFKVSYFKLIKQ